jgi:hypothetical protein
MNTPPLRSPEPAGVGTPHVESLTSYLARLAAMHSLTVAALVRSSLPTFLRPTEPNHRTNIGELPTTAERANGMSGTAEDWSATIGRLVARDLRPLTVRGWADALAAAGCLRRRIAHCAACLEEMAAAGCVYEPLAWSVVQITECPVHDVPLELACARCGAQQRPLRLRGRPGICGSCGGWLGRVGRDAALGGTRGSRAIASLLPMTLTQSALRQAIDAAIAASGTQRDLALRADVTRGSISMWQRGLLHPSRDGVLRLCASGSWDVAEFVEGRLVVNAHGALDGQATPRRRQAEIDWPAVRRRLKAFAKRTPPPSLAQVSRDLGVGPWSLRRQARAETQALVRRRRDWLDAAATGRMAGLTQLVTDVTTNLLATGSRASRREVELALPAGYQLRERVLGDAWRRARSDFTGP